VDFFNTDTTIAAISTPLGAGGIGIIRISGAGALAVLKTVFYPKDTSCSFQSHRFYYGHIREPQQQKIFDEVLVVFMKSPLSYTREDVVEIHCHGSSLVLNNILELVLQHGCVLAAPGEFTKRAFLHGRIDLTRAEAVVDILSAKTRKGVDLAQEQLGGALYKKIEPIRTSLAKMKAVLEVAIDFPDEENDIVDHESLRRELKTEVYQPLQKLLAGVDRGRLVREGISLVIAGLPNVGKSSLLNTILQEERALVTAVPGTTRDSIEEVVDIMGIPVRIVDTAGIREDVGEVEELGIERAKGLINSADLVLFMVDGSKDITDEDRRLYDLVCHKPMLAVMNKIDIGTVPSTASLFPGIRSWLRISAKKQFGIDELKQAVFDAVTTDGKLWEEEGCTPNVRHKQALVAALQACDRLSASLAAGLTYDLLAVDLQECLDQLAAIVGETTSEDILDLIFEQFCLGK